MGFENDLIIGFNRKNVYPTANTCSLKIILPMKYQQYAEFKNNMVTGIANSEGFLLH